MDIGRSVHEVGRRRSHWLADRHSLSIFQPDAIPTSSEHHGKSIIICCDGTANDPKQRDGEVAAATNVYRLYLALNDDTQFGTRQIAWYDPGVGTETSTMAKIAGWISTVFSSFLGLLPAWFNEFTRRLLKSLESATGVWIEENIEQGYREIVRNYEPGDRIFIFGFSRGAYTARCIAGLIGRCGLLKSENIRFSGDAMTLFRRRNRDIPPPVLKAEYIHDPAVVRVHVLGLWDTVASLGLPLWGWWFRVGAFWRNRNLDSSPAAVCEHVYHCMSMDEQRSQFFPTQATPDPQAKRQRIRQIWLRGAHADIGGGYGNRSLAKIGFEWMLQVAKFHGLNIRRDIEEISFHPSRQVDVPIAGDADPLGKLHDEIMSRPSWVIFGTWPRWAPVPRPAWSDEFQKVSCKTYGAPHDWVYYRAGCAAQLWRRRTLERRDHLNRARKDLLQQYSSLADCLKEELTPAVRLDTLAEMNDVADRASQLGIAADVTDRRVDALLARDGLIFLGMNQSFRLMLSAVAVWNRSGIVCEATGIYKIKYVCGEWRDGQRDSCGPSGRRPSKFDRVLRVFWRSRRLRDACWMELVGHVAHPRTWPVGEYGLYKLLKFVFWTNPAPLTKSLLRLGVHLKKADDEVYFVNLASSGIFYAFANDAWATYKTHSGTVEIEIERVANVPSADRTLAITPRGEVIPWSNVPDELKILLKKRQDAFLALPDEKRAGWPELAVTGQRIAADTTDKADPTASTLEEFPAAAVAFVDGVRDSSGRSSELDPFPHVSAIDLQIQRFLEAFAGAPHDAQAEKLSDRVVAMASNAVNMCMETLNRDGWTLNRAALRGRPARPDQAEGISKNVGVVQSGTTQKRIWGEEWYRDEI